MNNSAQRGQVMILSVLAIGGTILGATTIAGLLMLYQIRQSTDMVNSGKAVYAADTGIEWGLYQFFKPSSTHSQPIMSNGATFTIQCFSASSTVVSCKDDAMVKIKTLGESANIDRALDLSL